MPYDHFADLPTSVRDKPPRRAQEICKAAYESAWDQYADEAERRGEAAREETARRVARSAVNNKYEKRGDEWVRKSEQGHLNR